MSTDAQTINGLFERQASRNPHAIAIIGVDRKVAYGELDAEANALADELRTHDVSGRPVAIRLPDGIEQVVAQLAVMKAGAAMVCLDPNHPEQRQREILAECRPVVVIDGSGITKVRPGSSTSTSTGSGPGYLVYTSGSTGRPKGIRQPHRSFVQFLNWQAQAMGIGPGSRFVRWASVAYDASYCEVFGALGFGATLCVTDPEIRFDPANLVRWASDIHASILQVVPTFARELLPHLQLDSFESLTTLMLAGEELPVDLVLELRKRLPRVRVFNLYGPSETVLATYFPTEELPPSATRVPIGYPIEGRDILILDEHDRPCPDGTPGEIYIRSDYLTDGYVDRPEETASRYLPNPIEDGDSRPVYRTGDLGVRTSGVLEFLGRQDQLVKIRGQRVELGEIEAAMRRHSAIDEAAVVVRPMNGSSALLGYFTASAAIEISELRTHLQQYLPAHMIPQRLVQLDALPRNQNQKIDRSALPTPPMGRPKGLPASIVPRSELEQTIVALWRDALGIDDIGIADSFFELGGTSLLLASVRQRLSATLARPIPLVMLYEFPTIDALSAALDRDPPARVSVPARSRPDPQSRDDIAIIGMAGRFPGADSVDQLWTNLLSGTESITFFDHSTLERTEIDYASLADDPNYVPARGVLSNIEHFDADFFGFNPKQAMLTDPQHRMWLTLAWEALEAAACSPQKFGGRIGVFAGAGLLSPYLLNNLARDRGYLDRLLRYRAIDAYETTLANDREYLPTQTAFRFGLSGPAINVQTACSTSLVAIVLACQNLWNDESDVCLAGGMSIALPQERGYLYQEGGMQSRDGHTRPFDARASGTLFSSGGGVVVLKRARDAIADRDSIIAVIRGGALNNDGAVKASFTAPSIDGQCNVIAEAHARAGVSPDTIEYVEAHGTATPVGDPIEVAALTKAFRLGSSRRQYCGLGSLKSNFGHLTVAAGVAGVIKTALALREGVIPASLHFEQPNPEIDFEASPFFVVDATRAWNRSSHPRRAGVSSFGVGGTNAHVVMEEPPARTESGPSRKHALFTVSAKSPAALRRRASDLADYLERHSAEPLADVAYTLATGRDDMRYRASFVSPEMNLADAITQLRRLGASDELRRLSPKVAFVFPGQGAQHPRMAAELYEYEPVFRDHVDRACDFLTSLVDCDVRKILYETDPERADALLRQTRITQPALFVVENALAQLLMSWGVEPTSMIGHSVGDFVAAHLAGVFDLPSVLQLLSRRGNLMYGMPAGSMLAVRATPEQISDELSSDVEIAAHNAPQLCVVSGPSAALDAFHRVCDTRGIRAARLRTSHAFHSAMMDPILDAFAEEVAKVDPQPPTRPFVSSLTGLTITADQATDPRFWAEQLRRPVRFSQGISTLHESGIDIFLEMGPGQSLAGAIRQHGVTAVSMQSHPERPEPALASAMRGLGQLWTAGYAPDWSRFYGNEVRNRLALPTYPFEEKRYWINEPPLLAESEARGHDADVHHDHPIDEQSTPNSPEDAVRDALVDLIHERAGLSLTSAMHSMHFLDLGLDSLVLTQVSLELRERLGAEISFRQILESYSSVDALTSHLTMLRGAVPPSRAIVEPSAEVATDEIPLTEAQQEIWLATQLSDQANAAYNQGRILRLYGDLDEEALIEAARGTATQHEALSFRFSEDGATQRPVKAPVKVTVADLRDFDPSMREARFTETVAQAMANPFRLTHEAPLRLFLFRMALRDHRLLLIGHHIVFDGWSSSVFVDDLRRRYLVNCGDAIDRTPTSTPMRAYVAAERVSVERGDVARDLDYWKQHLSPSPAPLDLPTDRPRPATRTYRGATVRYTCAPQVFQDVRRLAAERETTVFCVLFAAYNTLLTRLSGQTDIAVGVPFQGVPVENRHRLVGHCVNFLPLRTELSLAQTFESLLQQVHERVLSALEHNTCTFGSIVRELRLPRDASRLPLVENIFNLAREIPNTPQGDLELVIEEPDKQALVFDLSLNVDQLAGRFELTWDFNPDLYEPDTIRRWLTHYETLLRAATTRPDCALSDLPLLTEDETHTLLFRWNRTTRNYPSLRGVHRFVEQQRERTPKAEAANFQGQRLTYSELDARANQLARYLREQGVRESNFVGICVRRSLFLPVALLGVLKSGAAYVPLDPEYPAARLAYIVNDAKVRLILTERALFDIFSVERVPLIDLPDLDLTAHSEDPLDTEVSPDHPAYLIYTSGSTGYPKGVVMPHRALTNLLHWQLQESTLGGGAATIQLTPLSFDVSFQETFATWAAGGRLVIIDEDQRQDAGALLELMEQEQVERVFLPFVALQRLAEAAVETSCFPTALREVVTAGEQLQLGPSLVTFFERLPNASLHNHYGPSETHVVTSYRLAGAPDQWPTLPPIGRPIANTQVFILDRHLQPVPIGVAGELFLGGVQVTTGYLDRPELTAERFIENPFAQGDRLYRTGDRARYLPDGNVEFLGRLDDQVKVRGFRIELGEIEAALTEHPDVAQAVVSVREDSPGDKRLVAYIISPRGPSVDVADIRRVLKARLPDYMLPQRYVPLDAFPRTPSGKIARRRLPAPTSVDPIREQSFVPPDGEIEERVAAIWCEVIGLSRVGRHDDFFEAGGHSLLGTRVLSRIQRSFGRRLSLRDLFESPTVAGISERIAAAHESEDREEVVF